MRSEMNEGINHVTALFIFLGFYLIGDWIASESREHRASCILHYTLASFVCCSLHGDWHDAFIMSTKFPEIQGGGSLILAWQIKGKEVLVVGGGEVSSP